MPVAYRPPSFTGGAYASLLNQAFNAIRKAFRLSASASDVIGRAGPGNTSDYVYEIIDGREYLFKAIEGNKSLELLPSDHENDAQNHWYMIGHGSFLDWNKSIAHMYREGMFVLIRVTESSYRLFVVGAGATKAQLRVNPTTKNIASNDIAFFPVTLL